MFREWVWLGLVNCLGLGLVGAGSTRILPSEAAKFQCRFAAWEGKIQLDPTLGVTVLTLLTAPNYSQQLSIIFAVCGKSGGALLTTTHMLTLPSQAAKFQHGVDISQPPRARSWWIPHQQAPDQDN